MSEFSVESPPNPEIAEVLSLGGHAVNPTGLEGERLYGRFPALATITYHEGRPTHTVTYYDNGTMNLFRRSFCETGDDEAILAKLYVAAGTVNALMRDLVEPHDEDHVADVYSVISSQDSLMREVLDTGESFGLTQTHVNELLMGIRGGHIKTDTSEINVIRLSLALIGMNRPHLSAELSTFKEFCRANLVEEVSKQSKRRYLSVHTAFGGSLESATNNFLSTLTPMLLAGSYPMPESEAQEIYRTISRK